MKYILILILSILSFNSYSQSKFKLKQVDKKEEIRKKKVKQQIKDSLNNFLKEDIIIKSVFIKDFLEVVYLSQLTGYKSYTMNSIEGKIIVLRYKTEDNRIYIIKTDLRK